MVIFAAGFGSQCLSPVLSLLAIDSSSSFVFLACTGQEQIYYTFLVIFRVVSVKGWDAEPQSSIANKVLGSSSRSRTNREEGSCKMNKTSETHVPIEFSARTTVGSSCAVLVEVPDNVSVETEDKGSPV